ncbi:MAG: hypothetical protein Q9220_005623 [cf. Caloplaca sp. 1 TL-2023]
MDELLDQAAISFEEDGVNHSVLDELKKTWQRRLTTTKCASFPWDPAPIPQPMMNPAPVPSNVPRPQQPPTTATTGSPALSNASNGSNTVRVKEEAPPYTNHGLPSGIQPNYGNSIAQQRAAQNLQQKYGPIANAQIHQLQAQAAMSNPGGLLQQTPQNIQLPPQLTEQQRRELAERERRRIQQTQLMQAQQRSQVSNAQTDGVGEWDDMVALRRAAMAEDPSATHLADSTMRQRLQESSLAMEGGGLMLPLSEQPKRAFANKSTPVLPSTTKRQNSQFDGPGDSDEDAKAIKNEELDDEEDEDAINSDLDDPDDDVVEEVGEDSNQGQIMLCTYDKVQRVKNKWKCVLKDGVLTTGGKEYVARDYVLITRLMMGIWANMNGLDIFFIKRMGSLNVVAVDEVYNTYVAGMISEWSTLLDHILQKLDHVRPLTILRQPELFDLNPKFQIAHHSFPIPSFPLPSHPQPSIANATTPQPPNQDSQKEATIPSSPPQPQHPSTPLLPPPLLSLLHSIRTSLTTTFPHSPPHTAQRLSELFLHPTRHYRTLPSYLRALDRVVSVSSPLSDFPLPAATTPWTTSSQTTTSTYLNGTLSPHPSRDAGTDADDTLGGAALTPIPWLQQQPRDPEVPAAFSAATTTGDHLRRESTTAIDGPNGVGSVETVTVATTTSTPNPTPNTLNANVGNNGTAAAAAGAGTVPRHQQAVTQGELIREEQIQGVVPVARHTVTPTQQQTEAGEEGTGAGGIVIPHARGPEEVGVADMGPQQLGRRTGGFDAEGAVGRKGEGEMMAGAGGGGGGKREGEGDGEMVGDGEGKEGGG